MTESKKHFWVINQKCLEQGIPISQDHRARRLSLINRCQMPVRDKTERKQ